MAIVGDEQVIKVLRQYNPWWRSPSAIKAERSLSFQPAALDGKSGIGILTESDIRRRIEF